MDEITRIDMIDELADRMLKTAPLDKPATEVWDEAAEIIDERHRQRLAWAADRAMIEDMEKEGLL